MASEKALREKLLPVSEQMKAWASALASELGEWPQVRQKSFFGFTALYRGKILFGLLPRTRSIFQPSMVAFRINSPTARVRSALENDPRISAFDKAKRRWFAFEVTSNSDLHDALTYLGQAFEAARTPKKTR